MSLSLLLEKYDVSTDDGLQKALNEIEKEESEVDEALSGALSRACMLEGRLRAASQAYTKLGEVKADAQVAADMVDRTAALARDVSAKVRQLDLARSRVAECQRRVHDLIDLQLCSAGVEAAIKAHDYETGAAHVSRFLSMDPGSLAAARARGAADPRRAMTQAANTLREHLVRKFDEAARKEDEASIERLFKLFPQIGCAEEGVDLLAKYLATQAEAKIRRACVVPEVEAGAAVFADAVTRVVEAGGAAVQRARRATALLPRAIRRIQPTVCSGVRRVYSEMVASRKLEADPRRSLAAPLAVEPVLAELALTHSRINLYFGFLRRKTEGASSSLKENEKQAAMEEVHKIISESELMRTAHDVLAHYLELERYFLEESVNKALKLAMPQVGATSSSLVDDVFFIARKVIRRAVSTGSVDGACAVLNDVAALLERDVAAALRRWLRSPPPDPLPLMPPRNNVPTVMEAAGSLAQRLNRDVDAQRLLFLAHMSEAEAGAEWSERLAAVACADAEPLLTKTADRSKLESCAAGLGSAAAAFRAAHELGLAAVGAALKPRLAAWAERLAAPAVDADELEDDADALPQALEQFAETGRGAVSARAADALLLAVLTELAARAEARILHNQYDRVCAVLAPSHTERRGAVSARAADALLLAVLTELAARAEARILHNQYDRVCAVLAPSHTERRGAVSARAADALLLAVLTELAARAEARILHNQYDRVCAVLAPSHTERRGAVSARAADALLLAVLTELAARAEARILHNQYDRVCAVLAPSHTERRGAVSARAADALLLAVLTELAARAEARILHNQYDRVCAVLAPSHTERRGAVSARAADALLLAVLTELAARAEARILHNQYDRVCAVLAPSHTERRGAVSARAADALLLAVLTELAARAEARILHNQYDRVCAVLAPRHTERRGAVSARAADALLLAVLTELAARAEARILHNQYDRVCAVLAPRHTERRGAVSARAADALLLAVLTELAARAEARILHNQYDRVCAVLAPRHTERRGAVSARAADALLLAVLTELAARAEARILHNQYDRVCAVLAPRHTERRGAVSARAADALLLAVLTELAARAEARILHNQYDRVCAVLAPRHTERRGAVSARAADALLLAVLTELAARAEARILHNQYDRVCAVLAPRHTERRGAVSARAADALLLAVLTELAARAEARILHNQYDREGGLCVERRARRLAAWAGAAGAGRERCARLTQAAALLGLERPAHAPDALRPAARLAANDAKDILARRTDFKMDDIKRLKL